MSFDDKKSALIAKRKGMFDRLQRVVRPKEAEIKKTLAELFECLSKAYIKITIDIIKIKSAQS